jgi:hypothetical protein
MTKWTIRANTAILIPPMRCNDGSEAGEMTNDEPVPFNPIALRARLAERDESYAAFLADPLYADEAAALMPGVAEWHAYRCLPPDAQEPSGLTAGDFARGYRDIPHPAGILDKKRGG